MADAVPIGGKDFRVFRLDTPNDTSPAYLGVITTSKVTETQELGDATTANTALPGALPTRSSVPVLRGWSVAVSGIFDPVIWQVVRGDFLAARTTLLRFVTARNKAGGGGRYDGAVWFENVEWSYTNLGVVQFSAQMRGEGDLTWTQAAT